MKLRRPPIQTPHGRFLPLVTRPGGFEHEKGVILPPAVPANQTGKTEGGGGEANDVLGVIAMWHGYTPSAVSYSLEHMVPYDENGVSLSFSLLDVYIHMTATYSSGTSFVLEKSSGGDVVFTPATVATTTVAAGHYYQHQDITYSVVSGDLLRLHFTAVGSAAQYVYEVIGAKV